MTIIMAAHAWASNADLMVDCRSLGYLRDDWVTLDPTYGRGTWWKKWRPSLLVAHDKFNLTHALGLGLTLHDRIEHIGRPGPQPPRLTQRHSRRNLSTLLVLTNGRVWSRGRVLAA